MKHISLDGNTIPTFLYGTAWKEEATRNLVVSALKAGFRGIDTANQRKHYFEVAVGEGLKSCYEQGTVKREDIFLQTKYTFIDGQDDRLPYDKDADYTTQVNQSFASSLEHLHTPYLDSYVLHGPSTRKGLADADWESWQAMEALCRDKKTNFLGISNVNYDQLVALLKDCKIKPRFVQNRCYANTQWDRKIRDLCQQHSIYYQGFSLLTANRQELKHPSIEEITTRHHRTLPQVVFRFALQVGMLPLTGTSSQEHMAQDLGAYDFALSHEEVNTIEKIAL